VRVFWLLVSPAAASASPDAFTYFSLSFLLSPSSYSHLASIIIKIPQPTFTTFSNYFFYICLLISSSPPTDKTARGVGVVSIPCIPAPYSASILKCECEADWLLLLEEKEEISEIRSK